MMRLSVTTKWTMCSLLQTLKEPSVNRKDLQALNLVGPTKDNPVQDPLAVLHLNNRLYIFVTWASFLVSCLNSIEGVLWCPNRWKKMKVNFTVFQHTKTVQFIISTLVFGSRGQGFEFRWGRKFFLCRYWVLIAVKRC